MNTRTQTLIFGALIAFTFGCAQRFHRYDSGSNTNLASRVPVPTDASLNSDLALCNGSSATYFESQIMVFYDGLNNYSANFLRLHLKNVAPDFETSKLHFVFRKWKANETGETYQDPNPLPLRVERASDHFSLSPYRTSLQWNALKADLQSFMTSTETASSLMEKVNFVIDLKDPEGTYDALKISVYLDSEWMEDVNLLIPAFYAHPTKYSQGHNGVLNQLHPLTSSASSSFATDYFKSFCF